MSKNRTRKLGLIAALTLVMMLLFSLATTAFAADYAEGTETDPAQAAITKILQMPVGTNIPAATFTFEFDAISVDGVAATNPKTPTNMPGITDISVTFPGTPAAAAVTGMPAGVDAYFIETEDIVDGITWPHAGIYKYSITEKANTYTLNATPPPLETMDYSLALYEIEVWVNNNAAGTGTYVQFIVARRITNDDGTPGTPGGDKVDPTPGTNPSQTEDYSQMIFNNVYTKSNGGVTPDDGVLTISKEVTGNFASTTLGFNFSVMVTKPAVGVPDPANYTAYKVDGAGNTIGSAITFASGTAQTVSLAHDESLVFTDLHVGSSFTVTETVVTNYTPSYTLNTVAGPAYAPPAATYGISTPTYLREAGDIVAFENEYDITGPTGLIMNNLPYIILIAAAALALTGFIVVKSRRNAKYHAR